MLYHPDRDQIPDVRRGLEQIGVERVLLVTET
jgi:hypothetical protein